MWSKITAFLAAAKVAAVAEAIWAESALKGKSGTEKKAAVIRRVSALITVPWYFAWAKDWCIGKAVDLVVEKLNWATGWDFAGVDISPATVDVVLAPQAVVQASTLNTTTASAALDVDARLNELYAQYNILKPTEAETETEKPETAPPTAPPASAVAAAADKRWEDSIPFILKYEGGDNFTVTNGVPVLKNSAKADKGGLTRMGITIGALKTAYAQGIVSHADITHLTKDEVKKIYKKNYWDAWGWGGLPWPVCLCLLDITVNHGGGGMARIVQRACNALKTGLTVDGKYGPKTKAALFALAATRPGILAEQICYYRRDYYDRIIVASPSQEVFRRGWYNRLSALAAAAGVKSPV